MFFVTPLLVCPGHFLTSGEQGLGYCHRHDRSKRIGYEPYSEELFVHLLATLSGDELFYERDAVRFELTDDSLENL